MRERGERDSERITTYKHPRSDNTSKVKDGDRRLLWRVEDYDDDDLTPLCITKRQIMVCQQASIRTATSSTATVNDQLI